MLKNYIMRNLLQYVCGGCLPVILGLAVMMPQHINANETSPEVPSFVALKLESHEWPSWFDPYGGESDPVGVYSVNGVEDTMLSERIDTSGIAAYDGENYLIHYEYPFVSWSTQLMMYSAATWQKEYEFFAMEQDCENIRDYMPISMAYDYVTGDFYGLFYTDEGRDLSAILVGPEYEPPVRYATVPLNIDKNTYVKSLCFDNDGNLYALTSGRETVIYDDEYTRRYYGEVSLSRIDRHTGEVTVIGSTGHLTGFASIDANSLYCDHVTGALHAVFHHMDRVDDEYVMTSELCRINPETGEATELVSYPDGRAYQGMYNPAPRWNQKSPDKCIDVQIKLPDDSEAGTVTLTTPEYTVGSMDGSAPERLEESLDIELTVDGQSVGTATADPGQSIEIPLDLSTIKTGTYTLTAVAANSTGNGVPARIHNIFYPGMGSGVDAEMCEKNLKLKVRENTVILSSVQPCPVIVSDVNGRVLFSGVVTNETSVNVATGIYIVQSPGYVRKIVVS